MTIGRLEIIITPWTVIGGALGLLWVGFSLGLFAEAGPRFARWREIRQWRQTCDREHGLFTIDEYSMSCQYPNGGRKSMALGQRAL
jgi:hypothetical protein